MDNVVRRCITRLALVVLLLLKCYFVMVQMPTYVTKMERHLLTRLEKDMIKVNIFFWILQYHESHQLY